MQPIALEQVSYPVPAASTVPRAMLTKSGKRAFFFFSFPSLMLLFALFLCLLKFQMRKVNIGRLSFVSHDQITS